jgi:antitoxin component YwqK of YwqJK toxin-antitoxin module
MKRLLLFASLLSALSLSASAQQKAVEFRQGDALRGPVRTARIEQATFSRVDGVLVEGPRRVVVVSTYTPDGKRKEYEGYAPDGTLRNRYVHVYDDAGNEVEMSVFDGAGKLQTKRVYRPLEGEVLTYAGDGSLRERSVSVKGSDGTLAETRLYDGSGALKERSVNERDGKTSVWSTYRADGSLKRRTEHSLNYGGPHHSETKSYAPDGRVVGRRVSDVDAAVSDLRATEARGDGGPPRETRETREYDSRGNLSKMVTFKWNAETGEYEPASVSYYTIEYYR